MANTLHQDIRAALQKRAVTVTGFPTARDYEGQAFTPVLGTPWARMQFIPNVSKPWDVAAAIDENRGLFLITLFYAAAEGSASIESVADAVRDKFRPGLDLTQGVARVRIERRERKQISPDANPAWVKLSIMIWWRVYSTN